MNLFGRRVRQTNCTDVTLENNNATLSASHSQARGTHAVHTIATATAVPYFSFGGRVLVHHRRLRVARAWQSRVCVLNDCANVSIAPSRAVYSLTAVTCVDVAAHNRGPDYGLHSTDSELHY